MYSFQSLGVIPYPCSDCFKNEMLLNAESNIVKLTCQLWLIYRNKICMFIAGCHLIWSTPRFQTGISFFEMQGVGLSVSFLCTICIVSSPSS